MKKIFLILSVIAVVTIGTSIAFADDTARDAMIAYSGTETFAKLSPDERRACMFWIAEGGQMSELCRSAATRLIAEEPDAVTPQQRRALFAATMGKVSTASKNRNSQPDREPKVIRKEDNSGSIIAAGIIGLVAGMVIHNNLPRHRGRVYHYPAPPRHHGHPRPPHYSRGPCIPRPAPYRAPAPHHSPAPVRKAPRVDILKTPPR